MTLPPIPRATLEATLARELPYRPHWPGNLDQALADPVVSAILHTLARHVPAMARRDADRARIGLQRPDGIVTHATRVEPSQRPPIRPRQPGLDFKSRAAGERDDSDE